MRKIGLNWFVGYVALKVLDPNLTKQRLSDIA